MKNLITLCLIAFVLIYCNNNSKTESDNNDSTMVDNEAQTELSNTEISLNEKTATTSDILITNDGIAGLKLGMTPDDIPSKLPGFEYEKRASDFEPIDMHILKKDGKDICFFDLGENKKIVSISVCGGYKTKEGIGQFSTVKDVSKVYTIAPYKIVEGAEGHPFVCLSIKEMPNVQMWLDVEVPEDYYTDEKKVLANIPETAKITGFYFEKID